MNKDRREMEYPVELESQLVLRLPEESGKILRDLLRSGDSLKNRMSIQIDNDLRNGEVRLDHRLMHAKIVDLPSIVESLKTIDNKSFYKTADICQMMICKDEPDRPAPEDDSPAKNKKKDPYKVDKKFLWPHGITPPTKNIRKRRFRKTLKKKYVEAPEIEKEVKRLLRTDNEAVSVSWEVIKEEEDSKPEPLDPKPAKPEKKAKPERNVKPEVVPEVNQESSSNVVDIFGGAVSDSDLEDDNVNVEMEDSRLSAYDSRLSDSNSIGDPTRERLPTQFHPEMFLSSQTKYAPGSHSGILKEVLDDAIEFQGTGKEGVSSRMERLGAELEELKQRRQRTVHEIAGMENMALRQRFQETLHAINQDILFKEREYQTLLRH